MKNYLFIVGTIIFTTLGQIIMKYGMSSFGEAPTTFKEIVRFLLKVGTSIYFIAACAFALTAALCWALALSKFEISFAYPFMSISFVLIVLLSIVLFGESVSVVRWMGVAAICLGVFLVSRS